MILWKSTSGDVVEVIEVDGCIRSRSGDSLPDYFGSFYRERGETLVVSGGGHILGENADQILGEHTHL